MLRIETVPGELSRGDFHRPQLPFTRASESYTDLAGTAPSRPHPALSDEVPGLGQQADGFESRDRRRTNANNWASTASQGRRESPSRNGICLQVREIYESIEPD